MPRPSPRWRTRKLKRSSPSSVNKSRRVSNRGPRRCMPISRRKPINGGRSSRQPISRADEHFCAAAGESIVTIKRRKFLHAGAVYDLSHASKNLGRRGRRLPAHATRQVGWLVALQRANQEGPNRPSSSERPASDFGLNRRRPPAAALRLLDRKSVV